MEKVKDDADHKAKLDELLAEFIRDLPYSPRREKFLREIYDLGYEAGCADTREGIAQ